MHLATSTLALILTSLAVAGAAPAGPQDPQPGPSLRIPAAKSAPSTPAVQNADVLSRTHADDGRPQTPLSPKSPTVLEATPPGNENFGKDAAGAKQSRTRKGKKHEDHGRKSSLGGGRGEGVAWDSLKGVQTKDMEERYRSDDSGTGAGHGD